MAKRAHFSSTTLSDAAGGKRLPSLAVTIAFVRACGADPAEWEQRWRSIAAELSAPAAPDNTGKGPYPGLSAYEVEDADRFFGREALIANIAGRLGGRRFVAVFGPSGSGKSSVLRAGLVPHLPGPVVVFTPGAHPLEECAVHLSARLGFSAPEAFRELKEDPGSLGVLVRQALAAGPADAQLVLVVDQFEEVFTLCRDADERVAFLTALITAAHGEQSRCRVVIGVRADFYARCTLHADLVAAWQDAMVTVTPMSADELRRAITGPARTAECTVEGALVTTLVAETHGEAGVLPLLSHALLETWRRRQGNTLTVAAFDAAGGIRGALVQTAEATFDALDQHQQEAARALFLRLCALGDGTEDTKRRVTLTEIDDVTVLDELTDARLVTRTQDDVEITHEALIRAWPRLSGWLAEDRDGQRLHRELTDATATWERHGRDPDSLLRGARLTAVADWAWDANAPLNKAEQRFLDESVAADERAYTRQRRSRHRRRATVLLQAALLTAVLVIDGAAVQSTIDGSGNRNAELAEWAVTEAVKMRDTAPSMAAYVALAGYRLDPTQRAGTTLVSTLATATSERLAAPHKVLTDYGLPSFTGGRNSGKQVRGTALLVDRQLRNMDMYLNVTHASMSAGGQLFALVDDQQVVRLSDRTTHRTVATLPGRFTRTAFDVISSRRLLAAEEEGGTTVLWDVTNSSAPQRGATIPGARGIFTGYYLVTVEQDIVRVWDVDKPAEPQMRLEARVPNASSAVVADAGADLVVGTATGELQLWELGEHPARPFAVVQAHSGPITAISASSDGRTVITAGEGKITPWYRNSEERLTKGADLDSRTPTTVALLWAPDGSSLLAVDEDNNEYQWHLDHEGANADACRMLSAARPTDEQWQRHFGSPPRLPMPCTA
ncbi:hypothetical protein BBK82_31220 [Lentzea guizhouensis]|uniref:Novel STAND NTPase 1 domain-containing protein n=1 Tax=Lentzea guizhouensis TaxID=1586287 RepID=A0A1B2HQ65_9PSEU|nr:hypothetical protein BBK82_31220 [Lentzea guizhouensis]